MACGSQKEKRPYKSKGVMSTKTGTIMKDALQAQTGTIWEQHKMIIEKTSNMFEYVKSHGSKMILKNNNKEVPMWRSGNESN